MYFISQHKLNGFKSGVSVLANVFVSNCSKHHPWSVSNLGIFQRNIGLHRRASNKIETEGAIPDFGILSGEYSRHWLRDMKVQGKLLEPSTQKEAENGSLNRAEEIENKKISSNRILVEKFFLGFACFGW